MRSPGTSGAWLTGLLKLGEVQSFGPVSVIPLRADTERRAVVCHTG